MEQSPARNRAINLMSEAPAAYLTTIDPDGWPVTRAMLNLRNEKRYPDLSPAFLSHTQDLTLYFTTNTSSGKVTHIGQNQKASVYFCSPDEWRGLMLGGRVTVVQDEQIKKSLWQKDWTMYYQGGLGDPDYTILSLKPHMAKYYEYLDSCTWNPMIDNE